MNQIVGGNANINGVGLFLAIAALFVSGVAAGMAFMVFLSSRDQIAASKEITSLEIKNVSDDVIKAQGDIEQLKIQFDELKSKK